VGTGKAPSRIRNSPTKPLVPGRDDNMMRRKTTAKAGMTFQMPP
jgi:hypothetical protein